VSCVQGRYADAMEQAAELLASPDEFLGSATHHLPLYCKLQQAEIHRLMGNFNEARGIYESIRLAYENSVSPRILMSRVRRGFLKCKRAEASSELNISSLKVLLKEAKLCVEEMNLDNGSGPT